MSQHPQRRPGSSSRGTRAPRAGAAGDRGAASTGSTRRARSASSRPATARPATAPAASATGVLRRSGRKATSPEAPGRSLLPQSALARQVAILGLVLCAVALSVAFPLRNYLEQRAELAQAVSAQQELEQQRDELQARKSALTDADYVAAEARRRLQYVTPGDTVFVVHAPDIAPAATDAAGGANPDEPWYGGLWATLAEDGAG
jgi:cell division protein FtsB